MKSLLSKWTGALISLFLALALHGLELHPTSGQVPETSGPAGANVNNNPARELPGASAGITVFKNETSTIGRLAEVRTSGARVFYVTNAVTNFTLTTAAFPTDGGTITGDGTFPSNSVQTLVATPDPGYEFVGWAEQGTGTNNPYDITVNGNLFVQGFFAPTNEIVLYVLTNGVGRISPVLNEKVLTKNHVYSLTATPYPDNDFAGWSGTINTNKNPLTFKAEESMIVEGNFVPNPFLVFRGNYNGLFAETNGVTEETAGMLKNLVVNQNGGYSGALLINGAGHELAGKFTLDGSATNRINRGLNEGGPLEVELNLATNTNGVPALNGTVMGTNNDIPWTAPLTADFATNVFASGPYTLLVPPDSSNNPPQDTPGGYGLALIYNDQGNLHNPESAHARISGVLADGTLISQSVPVSSDGYIPIYDNLYGGKGLLTGWINLTNWGASNVSLTWIHPVRPDLYKDAFTNFAPGSQVLVSPWTNPPALTTITNLSFFDTAGSTNVTASYRITVSTTGGISGDGVSGVITTDGYISLTVGSGAAKTNGYGAIVLNQMSGAGYFLGKSNSQVFIVSTSNNPVLNTNQ